MEEINVLQEFMRCVLPEEIEAYFDLVQVKKEDKVVHFWLEEKNELPPEHSHRNLKPNGFYEESDYTDFPLRNRKVELHIKRHRWIDSSGKSYSRDWKLSPTGTRYSKEFAAFLKVVFGYIPDTLSVT